MNADGCFGVEPFCEAFGVRRLLARFGRAISGIKSGAKTPRTPKALRTNVINLVTIQ